MKLRPWHLLALLWGSLAANSCERAAHSAAGSAPASAAGMEEAKAETETETNLEGPVRKPGEIVRARPISPAELRHYAALLEREGTKTHFEASAGEMFDFLGVLVDELAEGKPQRDRDLAYTILISLQGACPSPTQEAWREWLQWTRKENVFWTVRMD